MAHSASERIVNFNNYTAAMARVGAVNQGGDETAIAAADFEAKVTRSIADDVTGRAERLMILVMGMLTYNLHAAPDSIPELPHRFGESPETDAENINVLTTFLSTAPRPG